jgi:hypothetical protein
MKGGKQRQTEIRARQKKRTAKSKSAAPAAYRMIPVNETLLAPHNSYGVPDFVRRGYYVDVSFRCADCGIEEVWTGAQQKWWYEVAKGFVYSTAIRCRRCRREQRKRRAEMRRIHLEGKARKTRGTK